MAELKIEGRAESGKGAADGRDSRHQHRRQCKAPQRPAKTSGGLVVLL